MIDFIHDGVLSWAEAVGIFEKGTIKAQVSKVEEEVAELKVELQRGGEDISKVEMELGDVAITLMILAEMLNLDFGECVAHALDKIEKRKDRGKMLNGSFVKDQS